MPQAKRKPRRPRYAAAQARHFAGLPVPLPYARFWDQTLPEVSTVPQQPGMGRASFCSSLLWGTRQTDVLGFGGLGRGGPGARATCDLP